jgi:hypothetical protein
VRLASLVAKDPMNVGCTSRGYGQSKVRMLIIAGDLRSLKDGRARRILPAWFDEYVAMRASQADETWWSR